MSFTESELIQFGDKLMELVSEENRSIEEMKQDEAVQTQQTAPESGERQAQAAVIGPRGSVIRMVPVERMERRKEDRGHGALSAVYPGVI